MNATIEWLDMPDGPGWWWHYYQGRLMMRQIIKGRGTIPRVFEICGHSMGTSRSVYEYPGQWLRCTRLLPKPDADAKATYLHMHSIASALIERMDVVWRSLSAEDQEEVHAQFANAVIEPPLPDAASATPARQS